jgi:uncharacterized protein (TIGR04255 family)
MPLPKKITPCPIIEAVVEIRFSTSVPPDAIFGIVYEGFKDFFPNKPIDLPILQLPVQIRNSDPNLIYKPHYRFEDKNILLQIGPRTISIVNTNEYVGWAIFSPKIRECCNKMESLKVIEERTRFGLRYINFFEGQNVFDRLNLDISIEGKKVIDDKTSINIRRKADEFDNILKLSNSTRLQRNGNVMDGSLIDIDIFCGENGTPLSNDIEAILEKAHNTEKTVFFGLLKAEFLNNLNPEY